MILEKKVIFIFGIAKFDGQFESTSFTTAKFLARYNKVYYIDYPYTVKDYFLNRHTSEFNKRRKAFFNSSLCLLDTDIENLKILILPPVLSINFLPENWIYRWLLRRSENLIIRRLKQIMTRMKINELVFINSFNFHYPDVSIALKPILSVYHCVDPLVIDHDRRHGIVSEHMIVKNADLIVCTSLQLYREKKAENINTFFIPNAADLEHSVKAMDPSLEVHPLVGEIAGPRVGYFGNIERRMDFDLLAKLALLNPAVNFVFAGPVSEQYIPDGFRQMDNVHFIGRIPYDLMPSVIKGFDVAIIPFKKDEVSATIFPLKLFEYLGAGKPVIATDFNPDLKVFTRDTVYYCSSAQEFTGAIADSISQNNDQAKKARLLVASENTWEKRLTEFSTLIAEFYQYASSNKTI
ncbi:glycosyltransferase [Pedobacter sp. MC2016-24]|uniref:glycosyltransferase n=1 Tax=Pedobacter sp. MC2016-24 TaxID=2780090 RepID=UPI0018825DC0|nr:glycosyltransferase [Pedobacter sp. MC2016-24]MBE9602485.1 glycosyltransferase [Pedobacter sp. MC2016-24]